MLDRRHRLTTSSGFSTTTRRGRRAGTRTLVLHLHTPAPGAAASAAGAGPRVGFVVGRSVGIAVRRNLVKRRLRALARDRLEAVPAEAALVVRALPAAAGATYAGLAADFDGALRRLGVPVGSDEDTRRDTTRDPETDAEARTTRDDTAGTVHGR